MKLSRLLHAAGLTCTKEREITAIACHSDDVVPGALFVGLQGARSDGRRFVSDAVKRGAAAVLCSGGVETSVPVVETEDPRRALGLIAAEFYGRPAENMTLIAVTGTNGKTTTVSMLAKVLNEGGLPSRACGNIGLPMLDFCDMEEEFAVAEISSFQMETLNSLRPHIAIILNVTEDHLNRHYTMENYIFLKGKLLRNLTETEYAILNYDDPITRSFAEKTKAQVVYFSTKEAVRGAYFADGVLYYEKEKILSAEELVLDGEHNIQNALAVIAAAKIVGVENSAIATALTSFKGIKHRIEFVGEVGGVKFIDDSKGTNVDATLKAVAAMKEETVLLLGGKNKGYDYAKLFSTIVRSKIVHAVLYGENRYALLKSAREVGFSSITLCDSFSFAVRVATMKAKSGQTVLLSPASASFDEFANYEERGDKFVEIVCGLSVKEKEGEDAR